MNGPEIAALHRALCTALNVPAFRLGMTDERAWSDFLGVLSSLDETAGGPVTPHDVAAVIALMQKQRRDGTPWSLRYTRILRDPETFRDLVLETRRTLRPRRSPEPVARTRADGSRVLDERDPDAEAEAVRIRDAARAEMEKFRREMGR